MLYVVLIISTSSTRSVNAITQIVKISNRRRDLAKEKEKLDSMLIKIVVSGWRVV